MRKQAENYQSLLADYQRRLADCERQLTERESEWIIDFLGLNRPQEWYGIEFESDYTNYSITDKGSLVYCPKDGEPIVRIESVGVVCGVRKELLTELPHGGLYGLAAHGTIKDCLNYITPLKVGSAAYITGRVKGAKTLRDYLTGTPIFTTSVITSCSRVKS
jgi:hypothetical protein